jgi:hypothetical protein
MLTPERSQINTREEAIKIAEHYPTFLAGCENIKTQRIQKLSEVTWRVAAVDEDLGIVVLRLDFGRGSVMRGGDNSSLVPFEAFKVYGGQIHAVEAFMKVMPLGTPSGWN